MTAPGRMDPIVAVGHIPVRFRGGEPSFVRRLEEHYAGFLARSGDAALDVEIETCAAWKPAAGGEDLCIARQSGCWTFRRRDLLAEWEPGRRRLRLAQPSDIGSVDCMFRIVHTLLLAPEGGFLLHSSSVVRNGRALLFCGASGAGKSTISGLAPPDAILLADDTSYVRLRHAEYRAFGTPFSGKPGGRGVNTSAPVGAVYFLSKGRENRIEPLRPPEAVHCLMRSMLFFSREGLDSAEASGLAGRLFASACDFLQAAPAYRLTFAPDRRVWELLI